MTTPAGPLIGGIQFDETLAGHLQGLAKASQVVQNPAGSEPAAVLVTVRAVPNQLTARGLFVNIPNVRALAGTVVSCTVRGVAATNYWCDRAEIVGNPTRASADGTDYWAIEAQFTLVPLT